MPPHDSDFLDDLERRTFDFFWETTPADTGLTPDRWPSDSPSSIAAVGFGLSAYAVGVERGWIEREAAVERTLATLRFLASAPQHSEAPGSSGYRGFYYHFLDMKTGERWRRCELSSIDTALLMMGVLFCREYYDGDRAAEAEVRELADKLYRRVEWDWMQPRAPLIAMAWSPERQGYGAADYRGYNEAMLLYVLALGSPTHPVDPAAWEAYTSTYRWEDFYGQEHVNFDPLFGHQYSHVWIDFRGIQDAYMRSKGMDYFQNSTRATLSQRAYATENPSRWRGYSSNLWGLTACDGPAGVQQTYRGEPRRFHTYTARGVSTRRIRDDGTIAPTAAGGSLPFAPEETLAALQAMRDYGGDRLYSRYGFLDSFNPSYTYQSPKPRHGAVHEDIGWVAGDYLGIDQGPILLMAENLRTGLVWKWMRRNPYIITGLQKAGFQGGWLPPSTAESGTNRLRDEEAPQPAGR